MAKKIKLELTEPQFTALIDVVDTLSAMLGTGDADFDLIGAKQIRAIDRMLLKNGYKRKHS
ncbi:hypothetical protein AAIP42_000031 [Flavobacterium psychrophilum]|nr:hypothetical protein [Flavobacterium psychrophilum]